MRFLADENFNGKLLAGLHDVLPEIDIVRVQDTDMLEAMENRMKATPPDARPVTAWATSLSEMAS